MGQKQKRIRQKERQDKAAEKKKRADIESWDQTDSLEIPDRGETSKMPGLPSGNKKKKKKGETNDRWAP